MLNDKHEEYLSDMQVLTEHDWEQAGVRISAGWEHYLVFQHEPHVLLLRRPISTDGTIGMPPKKANIFVQNKIINLRR